MNKSQLLKKLAEARPKLAEHISHWALPKERRLPLDTVDMVKTSAHVFETQIRDLDPPQRLVAARNICSRAQELGVPGYESSLAYKYAGAQLSNHFQSFVTLRKDATAHLSDDELDKLLKVANIFKLESDAKKRVECLDKVASALEDFDERHGLTGHWGHWFPDPSYSTYGLTSSPEEEVQFVVKVGGFEVTASDFEDADWSRVEDKLPGEVVEGLKAADDKLAVFSSLPDPEKEVIYQNLFLG